MTTASPLSPPKMQGILAKKISDSLANNVLGFTLVELLFYLFFLTLVVAAVVQSSRTVIRTSTHFLSYNRESSTNQYVFQLLRNWLSKVGSHSSMPPLAPIVTESEKFLSESTFVAYNPVLIPGFFGSNGQCVNVRRKLLGIANVGSCENGNYDRLVASIQSNRDCKGQASTSREKNQTYQIYDFYVDENSQLICQNYNVSRLLGGEVVVKAHRVLAKHVTKFDVIYLLKQATHNYSAMRASELLQTNVNCIQGVSIVLTMRKNDETVANKNIENISTAIIERFANVKEC